MIGKIKREEKIDQKTSWLKDIEANQAKNMTELKELQGTVKHLRNCVFEGAEEVAKLAKAKFDERLEVVRARYQAEGWGFDEESLQDGWLSLGEKLAKRKGESND